MNSVDLTGPAAELKWAWHTAATLASWTMSSNGTVTAQVVRCDDFKVAQRPLKFVVPRPSGAWEYNVVTLQITGTSLSATVTP